MRFEVLGFVIFYFSLPSLVGSLVSRAEGACVADWCLVDVTWSPFSLHFLGEVSTYLRCVVYSFFVLMDLSFRVYAFLGDPNDTRLCLLNFCNEISLE